MKFRQQPSDIMKSLGIYAPSDIDLDLIAFSLGAEVKRSHLSDCEGYIIGTEEKAIITINDNAPPERQRFSLGHEIGHFVNDKKQNLTYRCTTSDMRQRTPQENNFRQHKEVRANQFAAELLIPDFIASPFLSDLPVTFESVHDLAGTFNVSRTSTAIRFVELSPYPCMLACFDKHGNRRWFSRSDLVPEHIWPHKHLSNHRTLLVPGAAEEVDADTWIDDESAHNFTVIQSVFSNSYDALCLLWWKDESHLLL